MIYRCVGYEHIDVDTVIGLTAAKITANVFYARIYIYTAAVRASYDGTAPVGGSTGEKLDVDDVIEVWGEPDMKALQMIKDGGTAGDAEVYYFGTK